MPDSTAKAGDVLPSAAGELMLKDQPLSYRLGTTDARAEVPTVTKVWFDTNVHARPLGFITLNKLLNISGACFLICKVGKIVRPTISQRLNELTNVKQLSKYLGQSKCSINAGYYVYS